MRWVPAVALMLTGCSPGHKFDKSTMTPDQMLDRATLVFVETIERHIFVNWPFLRIPGEDTEYWRVLDRQVRIEAIVRGTEHRDFIDVYEYFWVGGTTGDWNFIANSRYLFLVRRENGKYHVVRDWWRSIFPVDSGYHDRFPLDASRPLWERAALLQFWVGSGYRPGFPATNHLDPGRSLGRWRIIKLLRGLLRHPDPRLRLAAYEDLLFGGRSQDECYEQLDPQLKIQPGTYWNGRILAGERLRNERWEKEFAMQDWDRLRRGKADPGTREG